MKTRFTTNSKALADRLAVLSRLHMPMLAPTTTFELKGNRLTLKACDSEARLETRLETTDNEGDGSFVLDSRWTLEALGRIPDQPVTFEADGGRLTIRYCNGTLSCMAHDDDGDRFAATLDDADAMATMPLPTLRAALKRTLPFVASDDARPALNGVLVDMPEGGPLTLVSSDTHTIAAMEILNGNVSKARKEDMQAILPASKAQLLLRATEKGEGDAIIRTGERTAEVVTSTYRMTLMTAAGRFPNYRAVTGGEYDGAFKAKSDDMAKALGRMKGYAETCFAVSMDPGEKGVELGAKNATTKKNARETVACEEAAKQESPLQVNAETLAKILSSMDDKTASFRVGKGGRMIMVSPETQREDMRETNVTVCLMAA